MTYVSVPYDTYLKPTLALLQEPGLFLVTAGRAGKANAMAIGWGTLGVIWGKPIMQVLVRPSRYTYTLLEESDSFTVCLPAAAMAQAVTYCGSYSGRDGDKLAACGLQTLPSATVAAPGIAGCPVIYECRVVHKNDVNPPALAPDITAYPNGNYHRMYAGEILAARALPDAASLLV